MTLMEQVPRVAQQARAAGSRIRTTASLYYDGLFRPMSETETIYLEMSREIHGFKRRTTRERQLMHEYASSLLMGDGSVPLGMDPLLVGRVKAMHQARTFHYRQMHPFRARRKAAA